MIEIIYKQYVLIQVIFKLISMIHGYGVFCEIALK